MAEVGTTKYIGDQHSLVYGMFEDCLSRGALAGGVQEARCLVGCDFWYLDRRVWFGERLSIDVVVLLASLPCTCSSIRCINIV